MSEYVINLDEIPTVTVKFYVFLIGLCLGFLHRKSENLKKVLTKKCWEIKKCWQKKFLFQNKNPLIQKFIKLLKESLNKWGWFFPGKTTKKINCWINNLISLLKNFSPEKNAEKRRKYKNYWVYKNIWIFYSFFFWWFMTH